MSTSIVIIAFNEEKTIGLCLRCVAAFCPGSEVIVVDNGSDDATVIVARYFGATVVNEPRRGIAMARQAGFEKSTGKFVAFLDADTRIPRGWLERALPAFDDSRVAAVSGPCRYYDSPWHIRALSTAFQLITLTIAKLGMPVIQGGNFIVRRSALERIGGFDTSLTFWGEDADIGRRLAHVGKVHYRWRMQMAASGRRLVADGVFKTGIAYAANYLSIMLTGQPISHAHREVRAK